MVRIGLISSAGDYTTAPDLREAISERKNRGWMGHQHVDRAAPVFILSQPLMKSTPVEFLHTMLCYAHRLWCAANCALLQHNRLC